MDRLRYEANPKRGQPNQSPAVQFLRKINAVPQLVIGVICHSLWLYCAAPDILKGRKVTCAHIVMYDVMHARGDVQYKSNGIGTASPTFVDDPRPGVAKLVSGHHPEVVDQFVAKYLEVLGGRA